MLATSLPWKSALGQVLRLAAIPVAGWTDLHDALLPNGRPTTAPTGRQGSEPIAVLKQSTVLGLDYAGLDAGARYAQTSPDLGANFTAALATWHGAGALRIFLRRGGRPADRKALLVVAQVG